MALVRVYCGLASADPAARPASVGSTLVAAVVDDAGRLLDICEISDDPTGYARLGALLAERQAGLSGAAIATDSDDHMVVSLLSAAGRPLAVADDDSVDDFAERFADDESLEEIESAPTQRRAVGMARALQAGALSAVTLPVPRDLAGHKPVLAAHAALVNGRQSAAVALREVLRELYPAALRAYPDPADPVALAVLDTLPEPGLLSGPSARGRDAATTADAVAADLVAAGAGDPSAVANAVTALRVAISETPTRGPATKTLAAAIGETVRQAVAAVRAYDAGSDALVTALVARTTVPTAARRAVRHSGPSTVGDAPISAPPNPASHAVPSLAGEFTRLSGRRGRTESAAPGKAPHPLTASPAAPSPAVPPSAPAPAAHLSSTGRRRTPVDTVTDVSRLASDPYRTEPYRAEPPANRPVSVPPPPPPGMTPITPGQRGGIPPAEAGEPFRATLTTAAIQSARAERQRTAAANSRPKPKSEPKSAAGFGVTDYSVPVPTPRPTTEPAPPGDRANWPLVNTVDDLAHEIGEYEPERSLDDRVVTGPAPSGAPTTGGERIKPPWLADDLPPEPPMLRLVEPRPLADRALRDERPVDDDRHLGPSLRLVDHTEPAERNSRSDRAAVGRREHVAPPVADEGDGDLLIFAATRSAWFTGNPEESEVEWTSEADSGWQAAEQAAEPAIGDETKAGLPRRVPQANLVPGSPLRDERPLRIVRDPARIAEHTIGYFQGWRRGQEIGGFAVGGRPGREAAGGWDFTRDPEIHEGSREYEYRSAGY